MEISLNSLPASSSSLYFLPIATLQITSRISAPNSSVKSTTDVEEQEEEEHWLSMSFIMDLVSYSLTLRKERNFWVGLFLGLEYLILVSKLGSWRWRADDLENAILTGWPKGAPPLKVKATRVRAAVSVGSSEGCCNVMIPHQQHQK